MAGPTTERLDSDIKELHADIVDVKDQIHGLRDDLKDEIRKVREVFAPEVAKIGTELKTLMTEFPPLRNDFIALKSRFDLLLSQIRWIVGILAVNFLGLIGSSYWTVWQASRIVTNLETNTTQIEGNTKQIKELSDSLKQISSSLISNQNGLQKKIDEILRSTSSRFEGALEKVGSRIVDEIHSQLPAGISRLRLRIMQSDLLIARTTDDSIEFRLSTRSISGISGDPQALKAQIFLSKKIVIGSKSIILSQSSYARITDKQIVINLVFENPADLKEVKRALEKENGAIDTTVIIDTFSKSGE